MNEEKHLLHAKRIFEDALEADVDDPRWLDRLCEAHIDVASEIRLLHAEMRAGAEAVACIGLGRSLAELVTAYHGNEAATAGASQSHAALNTALGGLARERHGRFSLRGEVGRGGMGTVLKVWDHDLRRSLAMKVMRARMSSSAGGPRAVARFVEEAQVTAQLDHPGVVPVHEIGLDARGEIYFTMKLVRGKHFGLVIDDVRAARDDWTLVRAVRVLLKICEAVAYAHSKGLVHRDLKPQNVMVGRFGEVFVMDWGLAKVVANSAGRQAGASDSLVLRSVRTEAATNTPASPLLTTAGEVVGTPAYMAPELATGDPTTVATTSDIYALGAMLYHLLAGAPPYVAGMREVDTLGVLERLRNGPPKPLMELAPKAPSELVAVCEKAMERALAHRYCDVNALRADLEAWLEGRVVAAFERGAWAELRKWIGRNRTAAALLALCAGVVLTGWIVCTVLWLAAQAAQQRAAVAGREAADRAQEAEQTVAFFEDIFDHASPLHSADQGRTPIRDVVAQATRAISSSLHGTPGARARMLARLGQVNQMTGQPERAIEFLREAIDLAADTGPEHRRWWQWREDLANSLAAVDRLEDAERELAAAVAQHRAMGSTEPAHGATLLAALGWVRTRQRRWQDAEPALREAMAIVGAGGTAIHPGDVAMVANAYAGLLTDTGRHAEARPLFAEVVAVRERIRPDSPRLITALHNLARCLTALRDHDAALGALARAEDLVRRVFGADHAEAAMVLRARAAALSAAGKFHDAERTYREALSICERSSPAPSDVAWTLNDLAVLLVGQQRAAEAVPLLERAVVVYDSARQASDAVMARGNLAMALVDSDCARALDAAQNAVDTGEEAGVATRVRAYAQRARVRALQRLGRVDDALAAVDQALDLLRDAMPADLDLRGDLWRYRAVFANERGDPAAAEAAATSAIADLRACGRDPGPELGSAQHELGRAAWRLERKEQAMQHFGTAVATFRRACPDGHFLMFWPLLNLGAIKVRGGELAAGVELLRDACTFGQRFRHDRTQLATAHDCLGGALVALRQFAEAEQALLAAHALWTEGLPADAAATRQARAALHQLYEAWGRPDEAKKW